MPGFPLPIKGISLGTSEDRPAPLTTGHMNNIRIKDTLEKKLRLSKRPGLDKVFTQQIGGATSPIVFVGVVTVVD